MAPMLNALIAIGLFAWIVWMVVKCDDFVGIEEIIIEHSCAHHTMAFTAIYNIVRIENIQYSHWRSLSSSIRFKINTHTHKNSNKISNDGKILQRRCENTFDNNNDKNKWQNEWKKKRAHTTTKYCYWEIAHFKNWLSSIWLDERNSCGHLVGVRNRYECVLVIWLLIFLIVAHFTL